jgi:Na+/proline symporter
VQYLSSPDWIIIGLYLAISLGIGIALRGRAGKSLGDFFLGGRSLPWYLVGVSMVATTFAADTPLWVAEKVAQHGVSGNWLWWNMVIGGMLTTFFFARLWRRAGVLTELEFIELRYAGRLAALLRGFKAVYLGLFMNVIIIGWVNFALMKILEVFFDIPAYNPDLPLSDNPILLYIGGAMLLVAIYSSLSGLLGVVVTDAVQFVLAMAGCIVLAVVVLQHPQVGGVAGLKAQLPAWRFAFFPSIGQGGLIETVGAYSVGFGAFLTFALVQWWASWYPGAEPGGGGYIAQRMMSAKDERHAFWATFFFQVAHYCLRPWPWIITGLCLLILYPQLGVENAGKGYVLAMRDHLPAGLRGLLLVAFLSAYMSTISTQLNWGSSFLVNDLYLRFGGKQGDSSEEMLQKRMVKAGRIATFAIMLIALYSTTLINTIDSAARFLIEAGAGLGLVLILRWYWWRINGWSELVAMLAPIPAYLLANYVWEWGYPINFLFTVSVTVAAIFAAVFIAGPEPQEHLNAFARRVYPGGWWRGMSVAPRHDLWRATVGWISSVVLIYCILYAVGNVIIYRDYLRLVATCLLAAAALWGVRYSLVNNEQ